MYLESLSVRNFKCFENLEVNFGKLSVLSGHNSTGKTTAIQPILLLSQAMNSRPDKDGDFGKYWPLNGRLTKLEKTGDVLYKKSSEKSINFGFEFTGKKKFSFDFKLEANKETLITNSASVKSLKSLTKISNLCFISSIRRSTSKTYPRPENSEYSNVMLDIDGKHSCYLYDVKAGEDTKFYENVNYWLGQISKGAKVQILALSDFTIFEQKFKMSEESDWYVPANVGLGLSYAFPIIVSALAAKEGDMLIVDSPEAHLHPSAQSSMGRMLAETAKKGVQVIVETHSDHILNGIRLAVKDKVLKPEDLCILFFSGSNVAPHKVNYTKIDQYGRLSEWPEGFFDQIEIDTFKLLGVD